MSALAQCGSPGAHLGVGALNTRAIGFYQRLGFEVLLRVDSRSGASVYMGRRIEGERPLSSGVTTGFTDPK
jgi:ribosomal protein S18 acetylase RimI-like enzyme